MAMKMKSNDDVSSASVDGITYEPDADGVFDVNNENHVAVLAGPPFNFEMISDDSEAPAPADEPETDEARVAREAQEARDDIAKNIAAFEEVDPTTMANRGVVVKWLAENGDTESKSSEDRDVLNDKVIALRDAKVAELKEQLAELEAPAE